MDLFDLSRKYNCVKTYDKFKYAWAFCKEIYPKHFGPRRDIIKTVLEIGVHAGGSLRMWEEYFPKAQIYGIDIIDCFQDEGRIKFRQGNQADSAFLLDVTSEVGSWDIVIDDGSHVFNDQKVSFETLWPHLSQGGLYAIEDVMRRHSGSLPCIDYFRDVIRTKFTDEAPVVDIKSITFYPHIIIVEKS